MKTFFNTAVNYLRVFKEKNSVFLCVLRFCVLSFIFLSNPLSAQQNKKVIIEGNKNYENKKYNEAEKDYKKALQQNKNNNTSIYNLGNTYYQEGKYEEAANQFQSLTHQPIAKDTMAGIYHNLGNSLLMQKKFEESINAYKNALKNNPNDDETRYNLAYAKKMLRQQQQQQKNDKNKENKDDKNKKDKKDKKKDKKDKEKKDDKNKKDKEKKEQQPQNNISKEDAQRLLDALQNDEKNVQDKVKKGKVGVKVQIEKDW
jgi:tetratricopeptide (TPR) repeat protein